MVGGGATLTLTPTLWGNPCLDAVAFEVWPAWMLCFNRDGCCAFAVVGAVLWKDAPPVIFSGLKIPQI